MRYRPISPDLLVAELTELITERDRRWTRVAVDGAGDGPRLLAGSLVEPLRVRGRAALHVSARDFLRPASLRFERGRHDPDERYLSWLDANALRREVLSPLEPDGSGAVLPALWDAERDRATRLPRTALAAGGVLLVDGEFLLGAGLPFDLAVHLWLSPGALRRRLPEDEAWALPAFARYEDEVNPAGLADLVVRADDPRHPAVREG
ncbi:uridine kinase [Amycolatopsis minnesotensis]|uniref:Uridine kinase n=1 Tax=Amycolatopsis minnesotensis TaxID=337894 RepID=A0ABN2S7V5_9PSEU